MRFTNRDIGLLAVAALLIAAMVPALLMVGGVLGAAFTLHADCTATTGAVISAAKFNNCMTGIQTGINAIDNSRVATGAGIVGSKLDLTSGTGRIQMSPAAFSGVPSTTGAVFNSAAVTITDSDTAASGTATAFAAYAFQQPTLAAANTSVTTTTAATVYIANSPAAGTNQTITTPVALWVDAGYSQLDGNVGIGAGAVGANTILSVAGSFTAASGQIGRALNINTSITGAAGQNVDGLRVAPTFAEAGSGTHALLASARIDIATVTAGAAAVTDTASLYIQGAMSATVSGANYAMWVDAGNVRLDGILLSGTTVTTSASAGEMVLANAGHLRGVNAAGTDTLRVVGIDSADDVAIGGGGSGDAYAKVKINAAASLPAGAAGRNGLITFDTTNNRIVFYSGGLRYYVATGGTF